MKRLILTTIIILISLGAFAGPDSLQTAKDTIKTGKKGNKGIKFHISDGDGGRLVSVNDTTPDIPEHSTKIYPKFSFGITLARLDLGLATLVDNGSFTLSPQNQFLRYRSWKTTNTGFDVLQMGVRFSNNFKVYLSGGFDWTLIRLRDNITILPNQPVLTYRQDNIQYSKNRFSASYLRIPLSFEFRTNEDADGKRFHFVVGPDGGFLLNARVKQISTENGKQKIDDTYNLATFRYGAFARVGYGAWGLFAKYYFNDMFPNSPEQDGLRNFSFGIMLGF